MNYREVNLQGETHQPKKRKFRPPIENLKFEGKIKNLRHQHRGDFNEWTKRTSTNKNWSWGATNDHQPIKLKNQKFKRNQVETRATKDTQWERGDLNKIPEGQCRLIMNVVYWNDLTGQHVKFTNLLV